ncbi:CoA pyrophosphatase [uncultured Psychrobacter sp.]|uniref:NUDIX hydrolase n=1 Tax=uncultured Psychrobacter sp. TaxID=259303 RepID=UPI003458C97E
MAIPNNSVSFDRLTVASPEHIRQPALRQLAKRVQIETLGYEYEQSQTITRSYNSDQSELVLQRLHQTQIADASILVAITHERHPKLLLTRRASHMTSHAGEVSCAGGRYEYADGNNVVTALREACEETALPPNKVQLLGQLPPQTSKSGMSVRPIVALIEPNLILMPEPGEIARIFWADFEALITQPTVEYEVEYRMQDHLEQTATLLTPSWQVDGETVWGLTGRVIANLLETGFDRQLEWYYRLQESGLELDR